MYNIDKFLDKVVKKANEDGKTTVATFWGNLRRSQQLLLALRLELSKVGIDETVIKRVDVEKLINKDITGMKYSNIPVVAKFIFSSFKSVIKETLGAPVVPGPGGSGVPGGSVPSPGGGSSGGTGGSVPGGSSGGSGGGTGPGSSSTVSHTVTFKADSFSLVDGEAQIVKTVTGPAEPVSLSSLVFPVATIKAEHTSTKKINDDAKWRVTGAVIGDKTEAEIKAMSINDNIVVSVITSGK